MESDNRSGRENIKGFRSFLTLAGFRYWTASLLPALVGTTLPFWLHPSGFSFRRFAAIKFLFATVLVHAGFSFLLMSLEGDATSERQKPQLLKYAGACIFTACLLGLHLNSGLALHQGVPRGIFLIYGFVTLLVGILFVAPPINLHRRIGREIVIAEGLGMIPVLGAYLVQVGDITRTVYLASLPLIVATGLWVWVEELASKLEDEKAGRGTLVIEFGLKFSGRYGVLALAMLFFATTLVAALSSSTAPLTLTSLLLVGLVWKIVTTSWNHYLFMERMKVLERSVFMLHLAAGIIVAVSPLLSQLFIVR